MELFMGLVAGIVWGYIFQRTRIIRFNKQVGLLLLKDFTVLKYLLAAVTVGTIGVNLLAQFGVISYAVKPTYAMANFIGGIIFGLGWALLGYCPGTSTGALAEGAIDAFFGILGGICGAIAFAHTYDWWKAHVYGIGAMGKVRIPELLSVHPLLAALVFAAMLVGFCYFLEKKDL
ncbi:YeeE/YedE thiosulfate transporter family protein [Thermodesulfatator atlanticus]|uniref:YeeE/YedE thiosulfate transporter family protein n=1 Tax=Thermodesulfatator atlanticus TaxID=501497 RepID=UPI0003B59EA5|nr:YeeE/YedE thiosulfate transporter family protein [Thermodesulfatator atlanticus]